ncbi:transcription initiation factor TFIID subunit 1-like [Hibiscus syriacus]|uniref:transcription initiation factor TFIID subunit 1-like n=1 Tax=Hibiscus syriacus TaxID=106335 RepID=UPI001921B54D|nr:transcription initiation factor TFIID subunit 1-like [Hibiscus syriacus]
MFGNVDNSGDLDADYLDENAKEHLAAVADKLGPSLTDIDLSDKSPHTPADAADQADGTEYVPPTKRRRGGKVGLSNILERIVETLRDNTEVSYLFLKPVS